MRPISAIFGDGYSDVARHALLLHPAVASLALLGIGRALCSPVPARSRVSLLADGAHTWRWSPHSREDLASPRGIGRSVLASSTCPRRVVWAATSIRSGVGPSTPGAWPQFVSRRIPTWMRRRRRRCGTPTSAGRSRTAGRIAPCDISRTTRARPRAVSRWTSRDRRGPPQHPACVRVYKTCSAWSPRSTGVASNGECIVAVVIAVDSTWRRDAGPTLTAGRASPARESFAPA